MIKGTKKEFENLAEFVLRDYLGKDYDSPVPMDIFAFAKAYLKMDVTYMIFHPEQGVEGMRFANQIYLDEDLKSPENLGARNFTVAHECAHELINWQDETYNPGTIKDFRGTHTHKGLVTENDFAEWQANVVGAYLLMRPYLVGWCLFTFSKKEKITIFGDASFPCMYPDDATAVKNMSSYMGVSKEALRYRLRELNMIEERPLCEYDFVTANCRCWR